MVPDYCYGEYFDENDKVVQLEVKGKAAHGSTPQDGVNAISKMMLNFTEKNNCKTSEPTVIGGGTYARAMEGIVAFGPMLPGRELTEHQAN